MRWILSGVVIAVAGLAGVLLGVRQAPTPVPSGSPEAATVELASGSAPKTDPVVESTSTAPVQAADKSEADDHCEGCGDDDETTEAQPAAAVTAAEPSEFANLTRLSVPETSGGMSLALPPLPEHSAVVYTASERVQGRSTEVRLVGQVRIAAATKGAEPALEWSSLEWQGQPLPGRYRTGFVDGRLVVLPGTPVVDGLLAVQLVQAARRFMLVHGHWPTDTLTHGQDIAVGGIPYRVVVPTVDRVEFYAAECVGDENVYPADDRTRDELAVATNAEGLVSCRHVTQASTPIGTQRSSLTITPLNPDAVAHVAPIHP